MRWAPPSTAASAASSDSTAASISIRNKLYCPYMVFSKVSTPIGELVLTASDAALTGVFFPTSRRGPAPTHQAGWEEAGAEGPAADILTRARQQLEEYFARNRTTFDLPLEALGSAFEHRVWNALRQIPYGSTTSYGALAKLLGDKHATRAVGLGIGFLPFARPTARVACLSPRSLASAP